MTAEQAYTGPHVWIVGGLAVVGLSGLSVALLLVVGRSWDTERAPRTDARLERVSEELRQHVIRTGQVPRALSELRADPRSTVPVGALVDGWDHALQYSTSGSDWELRSPGADGQVGTLDDLVAAGSGSVRVK